MLPKIWHALDLLLFNRVISVHHWSVLWQIRPHIWRLLCLRRGLIVWLKSKWGALFLYFESPFYHPGTRKTRFFNLRLYWIEEILSSISVDVSNQNGSRIHYYSQCIYETFLLSFPLRFLWKTNLQRVGDFPRKALFLATTFMAPFPPVNCECRRQTSGSFWLLSAEKPAEYHLKHFI